MDLRENPVPRRGATARQRGLFLLQLLTGVVGVSVFALLIIGTGARWGGGSILPVLLVAGLGVVVGTFVVLARLEREKFASQPVEPANFQHTLQDLTTSRREIVGAFEIERRRIERDLHDGAQQYLVASSMKVGEVALLIENARTATTAEDAYRALDAAASLIGAAQDDTDEALKALRLTVSGIHPKVLSDKGLEAAVRDMAARAGGSITVRTPHPLPAMPEGVVAAAYFFTSEALTNAAKYAPHARVTVLLAADQSLHVAVVDDGPGGATIRQGGGLSGMRERLAAFGGTLELSSPPGGPTTVRARIPLLLHSGEPGVVVPASPPGAPSAQSGPAGETQPPAVGRSEAAGAPAGPTQPPAVGRRIQGDELR
ncbi:MAG TPA: sensor histidine kinase [Actinomycetales bacterium]|nr:sensor histidine kinase [Actinomycetales bacterium]